MKPEHFKIANLSAQLQITVQSQLLSYPQFGLEDPNSKVSSDKFGYSISCHLVNDNDSSGLGRMILLCFLHGHIAVQVKKQTCEQPRLILAPNRPVPRHR